MARKNLAFRVFKKYLKKRKFPNFRLLGFYLFFVQFHTEHIKFHVLVVICEFSYDLSGCLQLLEILEISWNLKTLLEILEISWNLLDLLEIFV